MLAKWVFEACLCFPKEIVMIIDAYGMPTTGSWFDRVLVGWDRLSDWKCLALNDGDNGDASEYGIVRENETLAFGGYLFGTYLWQSRSIFGVAFSQQKLCELGPRWSIKVESSRSSGICGYSCVDIGSASKGDPLAGTCASKWFALDDSKTNIIIEFEIVSPPDEIVSPPDEIVSPPDEIVSPPDNDTKHVIIKAWERGSTKICSLPPTPDDFHLIMRCQFGRNQQWNFTFVSPNDH